MQIYCFCCHPFCRPYGAGDYLVSGSFAGHLYIWSVKDGTLVKSYQVSRDGGRDVFFLSFCTFALLRGWHMTISLFLNTTISLFLNAMHDFQSRPRGLRS